jgi:hypothetical protein
MSLRVVGRVSRSRDLPAAVTVERESADDESRLTLGDLRTRIPQVCPAGLLGTTRAADSNPVA